MGLLLIVGCSKQDPAPSPPPIQQYTLTVTGGSGGSVSSSGGRYDAGTSVTLTASPNAEYVFSSWSNGATENPLTVTVNSDLSLSASFEKRRYPLSVFTEGQGTVTETLVSAGKTPTEYSSGSVVRLTANAADGWTFSAWSGAVSSSTNPIELTLSEAKTVTATFIDIAQSYQNFFIPLNGDGTAASGTASFTYLGVGPKGGPSFRVEAIPNENSYFWHWQNVGEDIFFEKENPTIINAESTQVSQGLFFIAEPPFERIPGTDILQYFQVQDNDTYYKQEWDRTIEVGNQFLDSIFSISRIEVINTYNTLGDGEYHIVDTNNAGGREIQMVETAVLIQNVFSDVLIHEAGHIIDTPEIAGQTNYERSIELYNLYYQQYLDAGGDAATRPYQYQNRGEWFACATAAYFDALDGDGTIGGLSGLQTDYPLMYDLVQTILGPLENTGNATTTTGSSTTGSSTTGSGTTTDTSDSSSTTTSTTGSSTTGSGTTTSTSSSSTSYTTTLTPFANPDSGFGIFTKKVVVFDVPLYGTNQVDDTKLSHAANVMAQYLDNDEDGVPDNPLVVEALKNNNGFMLVWKNESDLSIFDSLANADAGQDLGADETIPAWHTNGQTGQFDATLEEVLHLITHIGYHNAYPNVFGEAVGSAIANAMDTARGGQFTSIPSSYPSGAWYTYDDDSCDYACQVTEYVFWALTSILGAHDNRLGEIDQEWLLNTNAKVQQTDPAVYNLLTDPQYGFPTVLPDGRYQQ